MSGLEEGSNPLLDLRVQLPPHPQYRPVDGLPESIAIIGANPRSCHLAPTDGWQRWACSRRIIGMHADIWFEIHPLPWLLLKSEAWVDWLAGHPFVFMQKHNPEVPGSTPFPKDELLEEFGPYFFTSQVAWMLALAITKQPKRIGIWGVEMEIARDEVINAQIAITDTAALEAARRILAGLDQAVDRELALANSLSDLSKAVGEYTYQRPGIQHFIQIARDRGIEVIVPGGCRIAEPPAPYRDWGV